MVTRGGTRGVNSEQACGTPSLWPITKGKSDRGPSADGREGMAGLAFGSLGKDRTVQAEPVGMLGCSRAGVSREGGDREGLEALRPW